MFSEVGLILTGSPPHFQEQVGWRNWLGLVNLFSSLVVTIHIFAMCCRKYHGGPQVCHFNIEPIFSPTFSNWEIALGHSLPLQFCPYWWLLRRNGHVFRGFPYGNWALGYMAVSTKLLRMNILQTYFAFREIVERNYMLLFFLDMVISELNIILCSSGHLISRAKQRAIYLAQKN